MSYSTGNLLFVNKRLRSFVAKFNPSMEIEQLEKDLIHLLEEKARLSKLEYSDDAYDDLEEKIHELEDSILEKYGTYLEDALHEVHDEYCPDSEVLFPIAYIPNKFSVENGEYKVPFSEGVFVDVDDYEGTNTKLVILPKPMRIILQINPTEQVVVWKPKDKN